MRGRAEPGGHVPAWQPARLLSASSSPAGFVLTAEQMGEEKKKRVMEVKSLGQLGWEL